jgi:hypothetical protein
MKHRMNDIAYIRHLEACIEKLEDDNASLKKQVSEYLDKWVQAQDLAAHRNMLLLTK